MPVTNLGIQALSPCIQRPPKTVMVVSTFQSRIKGKRLRTKGVIIMYKYQGTINAGSTPSFTCSLVNGEEAMFPSFVYYKVQAQNNDYEWVDVGPVEKLDHSKSTFSIVLTPEQTSALDVSVFTDNRRVVLQVFYADDNGTVMNNTESIEFKLTTLPVLATQYEEQPLVEDFKAVVGLVNVNEALAVWQFDVKVTLPIAKYSLEVEVLNPATGERETLALQTNLSPSLTELTVLFRPLFGVMDAEYTLRYRIVSLGDQVLEDEVPLVLSID